jgi:CspA family cold shock protein
MVSQNTSQQTQTQTQTKNQGQVKWFNKKNGYGFIVKLGDNEELFIHHSGIKAKTDCYVLLHPGEYVEFDIEQGKNGSQCTNVTGIGGGTLMCDVGEVVKTDRKKYKKPYAEKGGEVVETV